MLNQLPAASRTRARTHTHLTTTTTHSMEIYFQRGNHFFHELDQEQPKLMSAMDLLFKRFNRTFSESRGRGDERFFLLGI